MMEKNGLIKIIQLGCEIENYVISGTGNKKEVLQKSLSITKFKQPLNKLNLFIINFPINFADVKKYKNDI